MNWWAVILVGIGWVCCLSPVIIAMVMVFTVGISTGWVLAAIVPSLLAILAYSRVKP